MSAILILLWGVLGGLWRRVLGGWLGLPRSICYALSVPLAIPVMWAVHPSYGLPIQIGVALGAAVAFLAFFVVSCYPGGRFDVTREVLLKYGPFGLGYVWAKRYIPPEWHKNSFLDGWASVGEIFLGASFYACVGLLWLVQP